MNVNSFEPKNCERCLAPLPPGALACERCHALVHGDQLKRLAAEARTLEDSGDFDHARAHWEASLPLLPPESQQADWIRQQLATLPVGNATASGQKSQHPWAKKLGPLAPIAVLLAKGKGLLVLFKLNFLLSLFAFIGVYWALYGAAFGIGFAVLVLLHEMGHFIDIKRRGLPADMPVFFPGLGAFVRWRALGVSLETRSEISLAGPLAGTIAAVACGLMWRNTGNHLWAALAYTSAWLNLLNLIPVWVLDGGQAMLALGKAQRIVVLTASLLLWHAYDENMFLFVAAGAVWRLFTKDLPEEPSAKATAYFVALLVALGAIMMWIPKKYATF